MVPLFIQLKKLQKNRLMKEDVGLCLGMLGKHSLAVKNARKGFNANDTEDVIVQSELVNYIKCNKKMDAYLEELNEESK